MALLEDRLSDFFNAEELSERTLVKYPSIIISISVIYLLLVKWIIPTIMMNRKPFSLRWLMIVYDFSQTIVNAYLTYELFHISYSAWNYRCMLKNNPNLPTFQMAINAVAWKVYLVKIADLLDTVMFVLRKKDDQVSFLHVFHHILMCVLCCFFLRNIGSTSVGYFLGFCMSINTTVHVLVYFYYGLAAFGPHMNKYLTWKKYITIFQIVQFFIVLSYMAYGWATGCEEAGGLEITLFIYVFIILILFFNFYKKYKND